MGFNIKPKIERYTPTRLVKGWGIIDMTTGEILKQKNKNRIERYHAELWAIRRCDQLNKQKD